MASQRLVDSTIFFLFELLVKLLVVLGDVNEDYAEIVLIVARKRHYDR
ncbi:Hypothetical protein LOCK908_2159 [Lacticaseibacillus rhamnosus LOCK908]|uniref:Uncharacterized protein n=1 Tax=Lacticaseibacillus rhamnosus (strain LMS2-1) TaxID=525361 RepID=C2JZM3_LACRM|nr:conserved hypothetical protein [Lacticaseibacillus rhamnosus ATCC 8530]AGP74781.1 Hypothetical protein LOCK908_2159 [Lacticaseibacillus rhamnosus LOCK908]EEN79571.1 hypothetical protein HMPREF0539_2358 [Lacticaseibacillus rhamnosus LMS2-1]MDC8192212.1 hypothetical protein [Lacticaseibacillus rhamnosus]